MGKILKGLSGSKNVLLWLVSATFFMQMLDGTVLNTALPAIAQNLGQNPLNMQAAVVSYMLTVAFLIPASGWLADYFGARRVFIYAISIFTLGSVFCAASQSLTQLVISRIVQGAGGALMVPVGRLSIVRTVPKSELVSALSLITIPGLLGPLLGPFVGGFIVQYFSWHWIFLINLPIGVICAALTYYVMPKVKPVKIHFDFWGYILFSFAIVMISVSLGSVRGADIGRNAALFLFFGGIMLLAAHVRLAFLHPYKALFNPRIFMERSFSVGIIANLFLRFGGGAVPFLTPLLFQTALGYSPMKSGLTMIPLGITTILAKTFVERMLNLLGYRKFLTFNTIIIGLMLCCFYFVRHETPYWVVLVFLGGFGIFNSMQFTALNTITLIAVDARDLSQSNTLLSATMQISMSVGVSLAAGALAYFGAHTCATGSAAMLQSFHRTYLFLGALTALGSMLFISPLAKGIVDKPKNISN